MKKTLILFGLLFIAVSSFAGSIQDAQKRVITVKNTAVGGGSCDVHYQYAGTEYDNFRGDINVDSNNKFKGAIYNNATGGDICQVDFYISETVGDITGITLTAYIYTIDGNDDFDTLQATSGNHVCNGSENGYIEFEFSSAYTYTGSTDVAIVVTSGTEDSTNVPTVFMNIASGTYDLQTWDDSLEHYSNGSRDIAMKVYYE